jgi:hypothetical protein
MRAAAVAAFVLFVAGHAGAESLPWHHIRGLTPPARHLLATAADRSAVVRDLFDQIERSDVVVLLELAADRDIDSQRPFLRFLTVAGHLRFVVIHICWTPAPVAAYVALIGHELQHAVEIAENPSVRDQKSCARLYTTIGFATGERCFETLRARETEKRVREELFGRPAKPQ